MDPTPAPDFSDAYRPPIANQGYQGPPLNVRPGMFSVLCVIAIILGVLGLLSSLLTGLSLALQDALQQLFTPPAPTGGGPGQEIADIQQQMNAEVQAVNGKYFWTNVCMAVLHFFIAISLLLGGIFALRLAASGRKILTIACLATIVFEVVRGTIAVIIQMAMFPVIQQNMERMTAASGSDAGAAPAMAIAQGSMFLGICFTVAYILVKIAYYAYTVFYLSKPQIAQLFDAQNAQPALK